MAIDTAACVLEYTGMRCAISWMVKNVVAMLLAISPSASAEPQRVLKKAEELHRLTPQESASWIPVKIRGVITYVRGIGPDHVVQDDTGGVVIDWVCRPGDPPLKVGTEVLIEGHTNINPPTPRVKVNDLVVLGEPGLPAAKVSTISEILTAPVEASLVEFTGRIRSIRIEAAAIPRRLALDFGPRGARVNVWVSRWDETTRERFKPGMAVRVRGVPLRWKTSNWLPYTTFVVVHEPGWVDVLADPPPLETLAAVSIPQAISSRPYSEPGVPIKVRGVVTLNRPNEGFVMQGDGAALWVRPSETTSLNPGDCVEVVGFSEPGEERKELEDARVLGIQPDTLPAPAVLTPEDFKNAQPLWMDAQLVRIRGTLQQSSVSLTGTTIWLDFGKQTIPIHLPAGGREGPAPPPSGSVVEATGVLQAHLNQINRKIGWGVSDYEMLLQGPASIKLIRPASWWTRQRLAAALGVILLAAGGSALWALSLRRRVAEKSAALAREISARHDQEILAEERQRLARDLHDTIEQTLTGAALQLDAVEATYEGPQSGPGAEPLHLAQRLLDRSRDELRRAVWDLTPGLLEQSGLPAALRVMADEQSRSGVSVEVHCDPEAEGLPDRLSAHLCRVVQEATSNAIRHGRARHVVVSLKLEDPGVTLTIRDDGIGFDPSTALGIKDGHFGLNGMKERLRRLGGNCEISSLPGQGAVLLASCRIELEPPPGGKETLADE